MLNLSEIKEFFFKKVFKPDIGLWRIYFRYQRASKFPIPLRYIRELGKIKIRKKYSCYISTKSDIAKGVSFPHPVGIVIGDEVSIGSGSVIYQNVTIGAARRGEGSKGLYPKIGRNVTIYAGAVIVGGIEIGDGSVIGANSVVLKSMPEGSIAVGIPAREL